MNRIIKGAEHGCDLPGGDINSFRLPPLQDGRCHSVVPPIPPYTMILLAQEALEAQRVEQAEYLIEAVYALFD